MSVSEAISMTQNTTATSPASVSLQLTVQLANGLHARPAARLARAAQACSSSVRLVTETGSADAASLLDILSLGLSCGKEVTIEADGENAREDALMIASYLKEENS